VSVVRVPYLPGVVDTVDPSYTVVGSSITGFTASGVAHICAAVPTVKALFIFCKNGFKRDTKASSSYAKSATYDASGKRSYKSLQDGKNNSTYSGKTLGARKQGSQGSSSDQKDPYRLFSIMDGLDDNDTVELHPVPTHSDTALVPDASFSKTDMER
jgi:hypothetical protein